MPAIQKQRVIDILDVSSMISQLFVFPVFESESSQFDTLVNRHFRVLPHTCTF